MFWRNRIHAFASAALSLLGLFLWADLAEGEVWDRHPALREGGVINDFAYNPNNGMLCVAGMENGLWHMTYDDGWPMAWSFR